MTSGSVQGGSHEAANGSGRRYDRYEDLVTYLSAAERSALREMGRDPVRRRIPSAQALRLLSLGLAELSCGRLELTDAGRGALSALRSLPAPARRGTDGLG